MKVNKVKRPDNGGKWGKTQGSDGGQWRGCLSDSSKGVVRTME